MVDHDAALREGLSRAMAADVPRLARRLRNPRDRGARAALEASIARAGARRTAPLKLDYPAELPVSERHGELLEAIRRHQVLVICGETGSGKSTQLPKLCLEAGFGSRGMIAHTQPRRVAARALAARLSEELGTAPGTVVGYKVRFSDRTGPDTRVKLVTDGMLLAELQSDRDLRQYDAIILDEAHERSLNIDFLLGYLKRLLARRPDLKLIITSATIDPQRFSRHFDNAPIIEVSGRTWPVEVRYRPWREDDEVTDQARAVCEAVDELWREGPGDVLVFLPGERDIRETAEALRKHHPPGVEILPLFARLSAAEQQKIFHPGAPRRIVLATNVAETSLTVPRIRYVVDTGLVRMSRYSHRLKVQRLPIEPVSQASAEQRKGRCGRTGPGICIRLYPEEDFQARPVFTDPEILRTNLASVILQMQLLKLGEVADFPFVEPPETRLVNDGYRLLQALEAVDGRRRITALGRRLAAMPVDPRFARMLVEAERRACLDEVLTLVAALSLQDPRERPVEQRAAADEAHARFADTRSDFLALLKLWQAYGQQQRALSRNKLHRWCREHFLASNRMREWRDLRQQLQTQMKEQGARPNRLPADFENLHTSLLSGLLDHVGMKTEGHAYLGPRNLGFHIFPGSGLFAVKPKWIMAAELAETTRIYARTVAAIEPGWIERLAGHLVKREYTEPHWHAARRRVAARETVSLSGLVLASGRRVDYGRIAPAEARQIFIREGLVEGDYPDPPAFLRANRELVDAIRAEENRQRRRDLLVDGETRVAWYADRLPMDVHDGRKLEAWLKKHPEAERGLFWSREDLLAREPGTDEEAFPRFLLLNGYPLPLEYRFSPGEGVDGVTVVVPAALLGQLPQERLDWLVPGLLEEKITGLIRGLPKNLRRNFVPAPDFARACAESLAYAEGNLFRALSGQLQRMTGVEVPVGDWRPEGLPAHLRMRVRLQDGEGRLLAEGEDLEQLRAGYGDHAAAVLARAEVPDWPGRILQEWDFDRMPETLMLDGMRVWPALAEREGAVEQVLCASAQEAQATHRGGVRQLLMLACSEQVRYVRRQLPESSRPVQLYKQIGTGNALREDLLLAVFGRLLDEADRLPADRDGFSALTARLCPRLVPTAVQLSEQLTAILEQYQSLRARLRGGLSPAMLDAVQDIREQLDRLVFPGFVAVTPPEALASMPRYLRAAELRLDKLARGDSRDRQWMQQIRRQETRFRDRFGDDPARWDENPARRFRWLLEEYRVSLFAQELGTSEKVSAERLEQAWREMVEDR